MRKPKTPKPRKYRTQSGALKRAKALQALYPDLTFFPTLTYGGWRWVVAMADNDGNFKAYCS